MLWVKSLHIVFMVTWFAGLFYLPRLFVYHAMTAADDTPGQERFKIMERKLFYGIMTPGAVLTIAFGLWLWLGWFRGAGSWLHAKLAQMRRLAEEDMVMMTKEVSYSAMRMSRSLASKQEVMYCLDETESAVPAFLRRKETEGRGRRTPRSP